MALHTDTYYCHNDNTQRGKGRPWPCITAITFSLSSMTEAVLEGLESSPFTALLDSNYVATDSEYLQIQDILKGPTSRLQELSTQLEQLDEQYTQIQNEQASLLLSISKHRALISQVRKLPVDVLQEIFIACLPTTHNAVMSKREPPILLTQICSYWRNIAHATPQLWKSIHIAIPCNAPGMYAIESPNFQSMVQQVALRRSEAVLEWIKRSASCPLDISLNQWENTPSDGFYDSIMEYLIQFSERWRDVSFSAPYQALQLVAALPASKLPLLQSLFISCGRLHFSPVSAPLHLNDRQSLWITSGIMQAPKLREICLTQLNEDATQLPINWSQLTKFSLQGTSWGTSPPFTVSRAHKILSSCRDLISCRLEIGVRPDSQPPFFDTNASIISLPFLTKFSIREGADLASLFTLLRLPSLTTLEFQTAIWPTHDSNTNLTILLTRSQCTIKHLTTDAQFFKRQDFITCLRLCPLLESLSIRQSISPRTPPWPQADLPATCTIDDAILDMFTSSSSNSSDNDEEPAAGCLCPNLQIFNISSANAFSETSLLQFIKAKNGDIDSGGEPSVPGLMKLKTVIVAFHRRQINDIDPQLEPYRQAGLKVTISYPTMHFNPFSPFDGLPSTTQPVY